MKFKYKENELHLYTNSTEKININNKFYYYDNNGFVYDLNDKSERYKNSFLTKSNDTVNGIYHYSDGTPCDKDGNIYATIDGEMFKLLQPIKEVSCEKQCVTLNLDTPNYFISNINKELQYIKKWDCLEIYVNRNNSQEDRSLTLLVHELNNSSSPILVTIIQNGDVYSVNIQQENDVVNETTIEDNIVIKSHKVFYYNPQENSELFTLKLDINGGNKQAIVKSINQYVISQKEVIKQPKKQEEIKNCTLDEILNNEILNLNVELPESSIYNVNKLSEYVKNKHKEQEVLRYYYINKKFQNYEGLIYDTNGYEVNLIVESTDVMLGNQQTQSFSYYTSFVYQKQYYMEEVDYDNAFDIIIKNDELTIKSYGCLSLEGDIINYRIRIAHAEDYSKYCDVFVSFIKNKTTSNTPKHLKSLHKSISFDKNFNVSYNKGNKKIFFDRNNLFDINVTKQKQSKWLKTNIVNNYLYLYYDNNVMNEERNDIVTLTNGDIVKYIKITQEPYVNYHIQTEFNYYNLDYNEDKFIIKIMVYGGNQKLIINDSNCAYKYRIVDLNQYNFFTSYFIEITPTLNEEIQIINNELIFKHGDDENINAIVAFEQEFNENLLFETIICNNVIELEYDSTQYTFNVETYPYDDSAISCKSNFNWLKPIVNKHTITLRYDKNYFNNRSCKLTIYNNEFIDKPKVVEIIQKGTK